MEISMSTCLHTPNIIRDEVWRIAQRYFSTYFQIFTENLQHDSHDVCIMEGDTSANPPVSESKSAGGPRGDTPGQAYPRGQPPAPQSYRFREENRGEKKVTRSQVHNVTNAHKVFCAHTTPNPKTNSTVVPNSTSCRHLLGFWTPEPVELPLFLESIQTQLATRYEATTQGKSKGKPTHTPKAADWTLSLMAATTDVILYTAAQYLIVEDRDERTEESTFCNLMENTTKTHEMANYEANSAKPTVKTSSYVEKIVLRNVAYFDGQDTVKRSDDEPLMQLQDVPTLHTTFSKFDCFEARNDTTYGYCGGSQGTTDLREYLDEAFPWFLPSAITSTHPFHTCAVYDISHVPLPHHFLTSSQHSYLPAVLPWETANFETDFVGQCVGTSSQPVRYMFGTVIFIS